MMVSEANKEFVKSICGENVKVVDPVSTLAEFREACAKEADSYPGWEAEAIGRNIRALPIPEQWRPIETAPKDGSRIWGLWQVQHANWIYSSGACRIYANGDCYVEGYGKISQPTHWMPLPIPPAEEPK